ncbi:hypothetical protein LTR10_021155 [Elasticomyces elasticus]|uniref:GPI inositol-deacylase winged helix domain-containing protein n=1 Tax=Exophiala sideris TaxID=1016849 RepID=A0ABR0JPV9_9EURO|nr:hypothetical protein LTR10_021155 [Elasticomyces elasticus]KAK5038213.1 hypothetical protein LTS07_001682 [Exophiala sideris]KAK5044197.1 hypothetical protein LTR13_000553 [Exophiala sideris]KAK5067697.1 hypothetical protein LTR69_001686 [Exophiala sideris]KAK5184062.1 hypothetical protein LTR44_003568 [Eurotiomycetes sp. CCFEE 6388]
MKINSICAEVTDEAILEALHDLPRDMPETFRRVLHKVNLRGAAIQDLCRKIFATVAASQRPLTLQELRDAVSVVPGLKGWDAQKFVNDIEKAVYSCGSMLMVEEEHSTVHFAHHSVKQYLHSDGARTDTGAYHVNASEAELRLGEICVTYLNFETISMQLTKTETTTPVTSPRPNVGSSAVPSAIIRQVISRTTTKKIALKLLMDRKAVQYDFFSNLESVADQNPGTKSQQDFSEFSEHIFLPYAQEFWLSRSKGFWHETQLTYPLWLGLVAGEVQTVSLPWRFVGECWEWAVKNDHGPIVWEILRQWELDPGYKYLGEFGTSDVRTLLLEITLNHCNLKQKFFAPILRVACSCSSEDLAVKLLDQGADMMSQDWMGRTPLIIAASEGLTRLVELLLAAVPPNANLNAALYVAIGGGHEEVVELLVADDRIDVNAKTDNPEFITPLGKAITCGNDPMVHVLLQHRDINVNCKSHDYDFDLPSAETSPLQSAAFRGNIIVVRLLLGRKDVEVNIEDEHSRTALHLAAEYGHENIVSQLLERPGIRTDIRDRTGFSAYDLAEKGGHEGIMKLLKSHERPDSAPAS